MFEKLLAIIEEELNVEGMEITMDTDFKKDLKADSLDLFELVMALEEEFGVEISSEKLVGMSTVGDVVKYMKENGIEI
ncbi:MAG: acyl carrier protein [Lachnospiraceae bacterium]|nr:acyl carrier protein [Lachnospiraceae bacterium]